MGIIVVILLLAVGGCRKAGSWLVKEEIPQHADAMVLLTGTLADRVLQVDDLYSRKVADKVWIVQDRLRARSELEKRGVKLPSVSTLAKDALITLGIPEDNIETLAGNAASTKMEAESVRAFLQTQTGVNSVLLVTSSHHSRRAYSIFKASFRSLDNPPELFCSPSNYTGFHAEKWWRNKEDIQDVVYEYVKLVNFYLFEKRKLRKAE